MSDGAADGQEPILEFTVELDEPPSKVWRAITIPALRATWLPEVDLADPQPVASAPDEEVRYRLRERTPPFLESTVTFRIARTESGGTSLRIIHELDDARLRRMSRAAANANGPPQMRAA